MNRYLNDGRILSNAIFNLSCKFYYTLLLSILEIKCEIKMKRIKRKYANLFNNQYNIYYTINILYSIPKH